MKVRLLNKHFDVIAAGAGASGMAASISAASRGKNVLLLEKGERPGRKILASGNGRCNLMNYGPPRYYGDAGFAETVLRACTPAMITAFFNHYGLMLTREEEGRVYPLSCQASTVLSVLKTAMEIHNVKVLTNSPVSEIVRNGSEFSVITESGDCFSAGRVIISCGGTAQPRLGGSADGYRLLQSLGHSVIRPFPSLVPLTTDSKSISGLSGIRVRCRVSLVEDHAVLHTAEGEALFTDYGISGICVMQCARFSEGRKAHLELNLLYQAFQNEQQITDEMKRMRTLYDGFSPLCLLDGMLHQKVAYAVLKQAGIPMRGEKAGDLSDDQLLRIAETASRYRVMITGSRGFDFAQVTAGGAVCSEFEPSTMQSRIVPGLYAAGEVLNVDGDCGGFNLMFAFSSGLIAGRSV